MITGKMKRSMFSFWIHSAHFPQKQLYNAAFGQKWITKLLILECTVSITISGLFCTITNIQGISRHKSLFCGFHITGWLHLVCNDHFRILKRNLDNVIRRATIVGCSLNKLMLL